ncbi:MAG: efflux RND transporter periplasmic adaptor subunit [Gammaproteobacteria bacterium]|nr:efflux RND transporter periplasmic adaptor subunit [Gammaproteobacteria bacterium]
MSPGHPAGLPLTFHSVVILIALIAGCSKSGTDPSNNPAAPPPLPVTVLAVEPTRTPIIVEVIAQTEGAKETEVRARVGGILIKRLYQEGEPVKAGQPLFQIDQIPYQIALAQARANRAEAKARVDQAAREAARLKGLLDKQSISRKEYDDATSTSALSQAILQATEANMRQAELNLSYTTVTAPVSGLSGRAVKSEGSLIVTSDSLLTSIHQSDPMWVRFSLSESDMARVPGGRLTQKAVTGVQLVLPNGAAYSKPGRLNFLATSIDPNLGTQQFRAEFENPEGALLPGQFVRARILAGERDSVFLVPQAAVVQNEQGRLVFVADAENKVTPRPVQTGEWQGKDWVILSGLNAGDRVIIDNLMKLRPGAMVAPHPPQTAPTATLGDKAAPAAINSPTTVSVRQG